MNSKIKFIITTSLPIVFAVTGCSDGASTSLSEMATQNSAPQTTASVTNSSAPSTSTHTLPVTNLPKATSRFVAEVWADNWFAIWINGVKVGEDSIPITTERSFNAENITFEASYPLTVAMMSKDFTENETGLEYIGKPNQQIGDGGFIAQITDLTTGKIILTTSSKWLGLAIQIAPINPECESSSNPINECKHKQINEPAGWQKTTFDPSTWTKATEYSESEVGAKDGYYSVKWNSEALLIWGSDLKLQNTILWRAPTVTAGTSS